MRQFTLNASRCMRVAVVIEMAPWFRAPGCVCRFVHFIMFMCFAVSSYYRGGGRGGGHRDHGRTPSGGMERGGRLELQPHLFGAQTLHWRQGGSVCNTDTPPVWSSEMAHDPNYPWRLKGEDGQYWSWGWGVDDQDYDENTKTFQTQSET